MHGGFVQNGSKNADFDWYLCVNQRCLMPRWTEMKITPLLPVLNRPKYPELFMGDSRYPREIFSPLLRSRDTMIDWSAQVIITRRFGP